MPAYYAFAKRALAARGARALIVTVEARNAPSVRGHAKAGFRPLGSYYHLKLLGREIAWVPEGRLRAWLRAVEGHSGSI
jgi:hypothetical protein